jgi:hypothetical protein
LCTWRGEGRRSREGRHLVCMAGEGELVHMVWGRPPAARTGRGTEVRQGFTCHTVTGHTTGHTDMLSMSG